MQDLSGRVAVVTGGANGIGLGLARRFLREGMQVVVADNSAGDLARAERELAQLGDVLAVEVDVADAASVQHLADATVDRFGAAHVLCNNAGVGGLQRFSTTNQATWEWTMGVNLWGVIHGCRIFLPILAAQDRAYIVNTASVAGFTTGPYMAPYKVTKAAVMALSESLSNEFATEYPHIDVAVLCPGHTATAIRNDERNAPAGHISRAEADPGLEDLREKLNRANEEQGMSTDDIAELVVQGMAARKTHLFPHPEWLAKWQERVDNAKAQV
ncbi:SDR family NAD(P)-dependent oxidoreductase [Prescottella agglutinans]|uniref:NAD(P)-dependent dehydrogenase (Short-subunit alcohol dehydrogenase family) n=1 Tax=Prescottella agglutinans TaxID=1644129 RepID=A0ABT6MFJ6_9NOCA|nr:SDR family NAD(P)-dependent oxidoreductase [Prescottella agglutinans]MDH6282576.1 NAD(P)-dependent dehydrogenase (short-subunit alcohol dehydrogenase family) [Prescottella agglutinans]